MMERRLQRAATHLLQIGPNATTSAACYAKTRAVQQLLAAASKTPPGPRIGPWFDLRFSKHRIPWTAVLNERGYLSAFPLDRPGQNTSMTHDAGGHRKFVGLEEGEPHVRYPSPRRISRQPTPRASLSLRRAQLSTRGNVSYFLKSNPLQGGKQLKITEDPEIR